MKLKVRREVIKVVARGKKKKESQNDAPLLVEEENISPTLEKSMCCREAGKTTTDYDDLCHKDVD
jgi:hypothetical protein